MKVIILGGFLGSGKTTLLLQMAKLITANRDRAVSLAIIENEIGEIPIDGKALADYKVRELSSGCICCTLTADLAATIRQLHRDYDPEFIIVEATGLAQVDKITDVVKQYLPEVNWLKALVLADAYRWDELMEYMDVFLSTQLAGGDCILLNKCDLVGEAEAIRIREEIREIHPAATIYSISAKDDISNIIKKLLEVEP